MDEILAKLEEMQTDLRRVLEILNLLQGEAMGSWQWDKRSGLLKMFDVSGTQIGIFSVSDSPEQAQRERRVDLES